MKLLSFETKGAAHVGAALEDGIVDLTSALEDTHPNVPEGGSLLAIIQSGIDIDTIGEVSVRKLRDAARLDRYRVTDPKFLPPVLRPSKILALALNYQEHIDESRLSFFNEPIIFEKYPCNMIGHGDEIELPPFPQKVDEEHELALVVVDDLIDDQHHQGPPATGPGRDRKDGQPDRRAPRRRSPAPRRDRPGLRHPVMRLGCRRHRGPKRSDQDEVVGAFPGAIAEQRRAPPAGRPA